jgi:hypothetical protein
VENVEFTAPKGKSVCPESVYAPKIYPCAVKNVSIPRMIRIIAAHAEIPVLKVVARGNVSVALQEKLCVQGAAWMS